MYAIVKTGGKQYRVAADDIIEVEKLDVEPDAIVELEVVFIADGSTVTTDADALAKAKVFATVLEQFKGDKQIIFKFKKRKGYKRLKGHRQNLTKLRIDGISLDGKAPKVSKKVETKAAVSKEDEVKDEKKSAEKKVSAAAKTTGEAKAEKAGAGKAASKKSDEAKPAKEEAAEKKPAKATAAKKSDPEETKEEKSKAKTTKAKAEDASAEEKPKKKTTKKSEEDKTEE